MALTPKLLLNDRLPASAGALYTVPTGTSALIKSIVLVETGGVARTVTLYVTRDTDDGYLLNSAPLPAYGRMVSETPFVLEAGDVLYGNANVADVVTILISGAESI